MLKIKQWMIQDLLPVAALALLGAGIYSNSLHGEFHFDDYINIINNEAVHLKVLSPLTLLNAASNSPNKLRVISNISFALNYYFSELETFWYHTVNLLIHILNGISVYYLIFLTLNLPLLENKLKDRPRKIAFFAALIFVSHPVQIQSVTYIVQRMTSLSVFFFLLGLICYIKGKLRGGKNPRTIWLLTYFFGVLSFLCKETGILFPVVILLYEWIFFKESITTKLKARLTDVVILFVLAGVVVFFSRGFIISSMSTLYHQQKFNLMERLLTEPRVVIYYVSLLLFPLPSRLVLEYDFPLSTSFLHPQTTVVAIVINICFLAIGILYRRKSPLLSFAILWFYINLALESTFLPLALIFEHRLYLPSIGLFMLFSYKLFSIQKIPEKAKYLLMILIISALSVMTYQRNLVWNDEVSLWTDNISKTPLLARPYSNLGKEYLDKMILDKALSYCRRAVNIEPDFADAHLNLGSVYILLRDQKAAVNEIKKAIDLDPYRPEFYINLGRAYMVTNDVIKAAAAYEEAIKIDFSQKDRIEEFNFVSHKAIISLEKMLNEVPGNIDVRRQYIELLRLTGQKKEAIAAGQLLLEMDPANVKAWNDLGLLYYEENNVDKAISCFEKALEYDPDFGKAHMNLGMIYMGGDLNKSIAHLEKALDYMPEDKKLKRTLLILKAIRKWRYLKQRWLM